MMGRCPTPAANKPSRPSAQTTSGLVCALFSALAFILPAQAVAQPAVSVEFDCAASHDFAGFGLNVWALPGRQPALLKLLQELRVKYVRWKMLPDTDNAAAPGGASLSDLTGWVERLVPAQNAWYGPEAYAFFERLGALGINQLPASWFVPVNWRVGGPAPAQGETERPIEDAHVNDYGQLLAAEVAVLGRHGIRPYAIEMLNEPCCKITPPQYARLLQSFRSSQRSGGMTATPVVGPGTVFTGDNQPYLQEVARQGERLDIVSTHAYDALKTHEMASLAPLVAALPAGWRQPICVTEYGIDQELWYHATDAVEGVPYAVRAAAQTLALLGSGANAVFYWQAQDPPWEKEAAWGLLSREDKRRPAVDALRTILHPLEVGDAIASSGPREAALPAMLAAQPSLLVLEIANPDDHAEDYSIALRNCTAGPLSVTHSEAWPEGRAVQLHPGPGAGLSLTLPGDTVASLVIARQR